MNPVVYISLELKVRDLDPRLLVAAEILKQGFHVIIGQEWALTKNIFNVPKGIFIFKTVNEIQASHMFDAKQAGHYVTATDEEVLACACDACFQSGMSHSSAQLLDQFFAQSERHANSVIELFDELAPKTIVTGNPRLDLLSKWGAKHTKKEAASIHKAYGPYILFNTNFGWVNSIWNATEDARQIAIRTGHLDESDPKSVAAYDSEIDWERANMQELEGAIAWAIENLTDHTIIIRPHPAEDASHWYKTFDHYDQVVIIENTQHASWTLGADALVHATCSTGMEATAMGTPALSITPRPNAAQHEYILSNQVNCSVPDWHEAASVLTDFFSKKSGPLAESGQYNEILLDFFPLLGDGQAASRIAQAMTSLLEHGGGKIDPDYEWNPSPGRPWVQVDRRPEWQQKFTVESDEMAKRLGYMGGIVGLDRPIAMQKLDDSLFHLTLS